MRRRRRHAPRAAGCADDGGAVPEMRRGGVSEVFHPSLVLVEGPARSRTNLLAISTDWLWSLQKK
jgi:hypothetical protein